MPKVGMQPIRRSQLIHATLEAVDQVGMGDASIALIARMAGLSNGIISHYFQDKNGLLEATMRHLMSALSLAVRDRRQLLEDQSPRAQIRVIIEGNFDESQVNGPAMKTWLAFWASSMHQPSLRRLQRINDHRLYSNLCCELRRALPLAEARSAARGPRHARGRAPAPAPPRPPPPPPGPRRAGGGGGGGRGAGRPGEPFDTEQ